MSSLLLGDGENVYAHAPGLDYASDYVSQPHALLLPVNKSWRQRGCLRNTKPTSELEMAAPIVTAPRNQPDVLESAGRLVDEHLQADGRQLELSAQLKIATHSELA